ncbi:ketoacyl-ACP synthase III [Spirillospora sp. NPDC047279]|uniref:3-oxoacyl-ACP synthase III family protein n=1 Tax=Spirillospora sp. NPDC047279 TaxID=3155478 RepID=UPI0033DCFE90
MTNIGIVGVGAYLPERVLTNAEIEEFSDYDRSARRGRALHEWATRIHGGVERRRAAPDEATSDLCTKAAQVALKDAGYDAGDVDLLVLATLSNDHRLPPASAKVQHNLGFEGKFIQLDSACTGFLDAVLVGKALLETGMYARALVVCGDVTGPWLDPRDWLTQSVFGDGAGAAVLEPVADGYGLTHMVSGSDGHLGDYITIHDRGSRPESDPFLRIDFGKVHTWGIGRMAEAGRQVLKRAELEPADLDLVVPHQASARMVRETAEYLGVSMDKVVLTYPYVGNTVGSSVGVALHEHHSRTPIQDGDHVLLISVGAGMAWCAGLLRWGGRRSAELSG